MISLGDAAQVVGAVSTAATVLVAINAYKIQQRVEYYSIFRQDLTVVGNLLDRYDRAMSPELLFSVERSVFQILDQYRKERINSPIKDFLSNTSTKATILRAHSSCMKESKFSSVCSECIEELRVITARHRKKFPITCAFYGAVNTINSGMFERILIAPAAVAVADRYLNNIIEELENGSIDELVAIERISALAPEMSQLIINQEIQPVIDQIKIITSHVDSIHIQLNDRNLSSLSSAEQKASSLINISTGTDLKTNVKFVFDMFDKASLGINLTNLRDQCISAATIVDENFRKINE